MTVRFATTCDAPGCTARSAEYTAFPSCRECLEDICPAHAAPGSLDESVDGRPTVLCLACLTISKAEA